MAGCSSVKSAPPTGAALGGRGKKGAKALPPSVVTMLGDLPHISKPRKKFDDAVKEAVVKM